jgi:voltage-gated sodium channel
MVPAPKNFGTLLTTLVQERVVMTAIVLNTVVLMLRGFPELQASWGDALFVLDYVFTVYFVGEMLSKIGLEGWSGFWTKTWNRFDLVVVLLSTPVLVTVFCEIQDFSIILILRAARLLRLLRAFRFIPDSGRLWAGVLRALRASVGVFLALLIYNLILGLGAHFFFAEVAPEYFSNPLISMYSLFKVFTMEGWFEIPDQIAATAGLHMAVFARLYFVFTVLTGGILGLGLANAVFVDEMVIDNTNQVELIIERLREELAVSRRDRDLELSALRERVELLLVKLEEQAPSSTSSPP